MKHLLISPKKDIITFIMKGQENKKIKVFVGVSGGVDSSVTLALLQEQGFDVTGVFLKVWSPDFLPCTWRDERRSAMRVCATLGVPFLTLDCEKEYKDLVVDYMLAEYKAGCTPNPDVFCNKYVKFGTFLAKALKMGADYVATGHYARVREFPISNFQFSNGEQKKYELLESNDKEKDQSYFLHQLNQEQLSHTLFPIGHLQKSEVRELAKKFGLPTAEKKDSQGLCFIGKVDMKEFLAHYIDAKSGDVLSESGEVIGRHDGAVFYTIGERHGFVVSTPRTIADLTQIDAEGNIVRPRYYVIAKDISANTITVSSKADSSHEKLTSYKLKAISWVSEKSPDFSDTFDIRFRYRQEKQKCKIIRTGDSYKIIPESPQFGIAPGQSAVIYSGDICLGGGIIE
jgi:tRNA-specific 2-thiouridylase